MNLPQNNRIKYLLGIDGGGTKTEFLLTNLSGKEICRTVLQASNPNTAGIENTKSVLKQGVQTVCREIEHDEISVFAGIAGASDIDVKNEISKFLSEFGFGFFANGSDTECLVETALGDSNGVALIMGTGTVAFAQKDKTRQRIGGWGYMIDKGGSGYHFGADALESALRFIDGRKGSETLLRLIETKLGRSLTESIPQIYSVGAACVASFAPAVFEAYLHGDCDAERIIDRNCQEIAALIRTGCEYSQTEKAVICGGLCSQKDILEPFILKHLNLHCALSFSTEPMVNGAISLAKKGAKKC